LATEKNRIETHVKNTIFLRVKISLLLANQKAHRKIYVRPIGELVVKRIVTDMMFYCFSILPFWLTKSFWSKHFYRHGYKAHEYYRR
jgi:hypothetical protein